MLVLAVSGWAVVWPNLFVSIGVAGAFILVSRQRRWRDRKVLSKAAILPHTYIRCEPKTVRDMDIGEEGYINGSAVLISKRTHRVFVDWTASLSPAPRNPDDPFSPVKVRRLKRGFSLTVRTGDQFRTGSVPWGWYAPIIEILQADPQDGRQQGEASR